VIGRGVYLEQMVELGHVRDDGELVWDVAVHHVLVQERAGQQGFFGNIAHNGGSSSATCGSIKRLEIPMCSSATCGSIKSNEIPRCSCKLFAVPKLEKPSCSYISYLWVQKAGGIPTCYSATEG
jgi:hypothetical protein